MFGGNRWSPLVLTTIVCTLLSGVLGGVVFKVLEMRVPEFFELFGGDVTVIDETLDSQKISSEEEIIGDTFDGEGIEAEAPEPVMQTTGAQDTSSGGNARFGDHILVNKIKIKNEPKLMARAIREMLLREEKS